MASRETKPFPNDAGTRPDATNTVAKPYSDLYEKCVIRGFAIFAVLYLAALVYAIVLGGDPYSPEIRVQTAFLSLDHNLSSSRISTAGEITFNLSLTFFSPQFDNATEVLVFHRKELLATTVTDTFPRDTASSPCNGTVREKMAKAVFPRSETRVSDDTAGDLSSSKPVVEFSFLANARGSLRIPAEDERRGFNMTIRCPGVKLRFDPKTRAGMMAGEPSECKVSTEVEYKARYDDPPRRDDWGNQGLYSMQHL
ncbi:hypothetical protein RHSIM_Rhsim05G0014100 [Rhododendron simsii]|uniref:Late embryogenesis abundant protein LEA-2 subgroup domain-containing protein n=1 Tax=Rhododendron simsii TaxID=118357 RepID=A0A834GV63_RHOSS|nr:hypothetical protein RHSIM_Rhsim05G0014100 [Rhododendron simsii]